MNIYKIEHREELAGNYYIEANSEEDAVKKFQEIVAESGRR